MAAKAIPESRIREASFLYEKITGNIPFFTENIAARLAQLPSPLIIEATPKHEGPMFNFYEVALGISEIQKIKSRHELALPSLDFFVSGILSNFEKLNGNPSTISLLEKILLLNKAIFYDFEEGSDGTRKYDVGLPKFAHPMQVTYFLPANSEPWLIYTALLHDSIEDSYRYSLLKKWYDKKESKSLSEREKRQLIELCHLNKKDFSAGDKSKISIFEMATEHMIEDLMGTLGVRKDTKLYAKLSQSLDILTKRPWEKYEDYIARIASADAGLAPSLILLKMADRINNSNFPAPVSNGDNHIKERGAKLIKDAFKNYCIMENAKEVYMDPNFNSKYKEEFLDYYLALGNLTTVNMDELIIKLRAQAKKDTSKKYYGKKMDYWLSRIDDVNHKFYMSGGYGERTRERHKGILDFNGSIDKLSGFIDNKIYLREGKKRIPLIKEDNTGGTFVKLYKYASVIKALSAMHLAHDPFFNGTLAVGSLGHYSPFFSFYRALNMWQK